MLNKEKWEKKIVELALDGEKIAVVGGIPVSCIETNCANCELDSKSCRQEVIKWGNAEYKEPHPCANCKTDDKVWVRKDYWEEWAPRHFAKLENEIVYCFDFGRTSWTSNDGALIGWCYAKPYIEGIDP